VKHRKKPTDALVKFNLLHAFRASDEISGRDLFRQANNVSITEQATKDRQASGDPPSKQIGYFQMAEKRAWEELCEEDKAHWNDKASPEPPVDKSYTAPHILRSEPLHFDLL
jgi:hypothetical protein